MKILPHSTPVLCLTLEGFYAAYKTVPAPLFQLFPFTILLASMALQQRLLQDLAEIQRKPYPHIKLHLRDDLTKACLILSPDNIAPLHLTVNFGEQYPLTPPKITIQTHIKHPNVYHNYICASILNTSEGYTPAYTLKGIAIQLLSFFASDKIEQDSGGVVDLQSWRADPYNREGAGVEGLQKCMFCPYHARKTAKDNRNVPGYTPVDDESAKSRRRAKKRNSQNMSEIDLNQPMKKLGLAIKKALTRTKPSADCQLNKLPDDVIYLIAESLDTTDLMCFTRAWPERMGGQRGIMTTYNMIHNRELQCYVFKKGFNAPGVKLGVGVHVERRNISSEFDLLCEEAFLEPHNVRRAVQSLSFEHWLPLPISPKHYTSVKHDLLESLASIGREADVSPNSCDKVIYTFMNDIVVKISQEAEELSHKQRHSRAYTQYYITGEYTTLDSSSLEHASEKAIQSYFHLFHLLLCLATADPAIVLSANTMMHNFLNGQTDKNSIPNLGHLLIAVLISDFDLMREVTMTLIKETITRNVVWMLDKRGAKQPELSYMEAATSTSTYRLKTTFEASKTSYRLLMFLNLFRNTINRGSGAGRKSLVQLRDELFHTHGAPPRGTAGRLAAEIRDLQAVDTFPKFLRKMDIPQSDIPTASNFCAFLRQCVVNSMSQPKNYSVWALSQRQALKLRLEVEPEVVRRAGDDSSDKSAEFAPDKNLMSKERQNGTGSFFPRFRAPWQAAAGYEHADDGIRLSGRQDGNGWKGGRWSRGRGRRP